MAQTFLLHHEEFIHLKQVRLQFITWYFPLTYNTDYHNRFYIWVEVLTYNSSPWAFQTNNNCTFAVLSSPLIRWWYILYCRVIYYVITYYFTWSSPRKNCGPSKTWATQTIVITLRWALCSYTCVNLYQNSKGKESVSNGVNMKLTTKSMSWQTKWVKPWWLRSWIMWCWGRG